ncbi:MAG TPA: hypothetical protein VGN79_11295 [Devosia sp.]|jgi:hypothetical protein|nr:hypothetical protein [Devosia sp.]
MSISVFKLAEQIATSEGIRRFGLQPDELARAIESAIEEHELASRMFQHRDAAADAFHGLVRATQAAQRAAQAWNDVPSNTRRLVLDFVQQGAEADMVGERLEYVSNLLDEFREHYRRDQGNPGRSRASTADDLRPLRAFIMSLMDYWEEVTNLTPGHKATARDKETREEREAISPFMKVVSDAATTLGRNYTVGNFETITRDLKSRRRSA